MNKAEISATLQKLAKLRRQETEIQTKIESLHMDIKVYMDSRHLEEFTQDGYKVSWKWNERNMLDLGALREELPEVVKRYSRTTRSRRFVIQSTI